MKHVPIIDSLRAFAALIVCLFHFICTTTGLTFPKYINDFFYFGQHGISIFFVISGFIIPWAMYQNNYTLKSFPKFILKRLIRLEPPYLISIILILLFAFIKLKYNIGTPNDEPITTSRIFLHFGYLINFFSTCKWLNNVYWTLAIEFQYYIIISFMYLLFINSKIIIRISGYVLCFLMAFLVPDPTNSHFPIYAPLFLMGIITFQLKSKLISNTEYAIILLSCFYFSYIYFEPIVAIFGITTALIILFFSNIKIPILNYFGKMSYSIYLIHTIIGAAVINLLMKYCHNTAQQISLVIFALVITLISSFVMYLLVENPSKKLSSKIKL